MNNPPEAKAQIAGAAGEVIQRASRVHLNLGQDVIVTTEDKMRLCLRDHLAILEKRKAWIAPLGIFATLVVIFPTTTFKDFCYLTADTWKALFIFAGVFAFLWTGLALYRARQSSSIDNVIQNLKAKAIPDEEGDAPGLVIQKATSGQNNMLPDVAERDAARPRETRDGTLVILAAMYGVEDMHERTDKRIDVTEWLKAKMQDGRIEITVNNAVMGKDPAPFEEKYLWVQYSVDGKTGLDQMVGQGKVLCLP
jgi:hypothetical protein